MTRTHSIALLAAAAGLAFMGCKSSGDDGGATKTSQPTGTRVEINCAGATSIAPLMAKWTAEYERVAPGAQIYYQSVGSGAGVSKFLEHSVLFGTTDAPMTDAQLKDAKAPRFDPHSTHDGGSPRRSIGAGGCMQRESVPLARR
jgi:phosphate transport system substrate-binding protein